jgi:hypothetical protein
MFALSAEANITSPPYQGPTSAYENPTPIYTPPSNATTTYAPLSNATSPPNETSSPISWQLGKSLSECNRYMLDNQISTDVNIQVEYNGARSLLYAHRYMLISRSAVLERMVREAVYESRPGLPVVTLTISDTDPKILIVCKKLTT